MVITSNIIVTEVQEYDFERGHLDVLQQLNPTTSNVTRSMYCARLNERKKRGDLTLVAIDIITNCVVGSVSGDLLLKWNHSCGKVLEVEDAVVDEKYRNNGIGSMLINSIKEHGRNIGCYKINLYCKPKNQEFYKKLGFNAYEQQMAYYIKDQE